ncbi:MULTISPECIES: hypothetical protein [Enterobacteriaceae]|uniref:hypothetical protein n=1 Tax=Enterobacteriaceae TaxID=543 RepID=UPI000A5E508E|nr:MULTISPECIES: hypothetical protein [Enterobacteriaceae]EHK1953610.1 hypothetical protein [Salmonella enterica subsp. enterica serovar Anatum]EHL5274189.1 hypothetical protein [Salmonella enterica]DAI78192.1 MAG TPA: hypothetical protein [Caudoviricetes sp.]EHO7402708.1 hypothetical protein [Salmonella enterica]EIJ4983157.1 hypothetical protein [Salmonella enterica]
MTALKNRTQQNEQAKQCWDAIGKVMLGRANKDRDQDMTYQSGTSFNDFKAAFRAK